MLLISSDEILSSLENYQGKSGFCLVVSVVLFEVYFLFLVVPAATSTILRLLLLLLLLSYHYYRSSSL